MDHGGEAARTTSAGSAEIGMAGAVRGSEANIASNEFDGQLGAAAPRRGSFSDFDLSAVAGHGQVPVDVLSHLDQEPGPGSVAYPTDIGASWRQLGPVHVALIGPQLFSGGVVPLHGYYSALQARPGPGARRGVLLGALLPSGGGGSAGSRPGAGHGVVLLDQLSDDGRHGEALVGLLPGGVDAGYDDYSYYALQPRSDAGQGYVLVDQLPDGVGHGEAFVGLLPGGVGAAHDDYSYYAMHPRPGAGHGAVFVGLHPGGAGAVHDDYGYYYPLQPRPGAGRDEVFVGPLPDCVGQTLLGTGSADGIAGALRGPNLGALYDGSGALADDIGAVYNNRGMVSEHLRRLLPFVGIGASSVAINGLAAGPGSAAVAFQLFVLLLGGLFLVILHVLGV